VIGLSNRQLRIVMDGARRLSPEKRLLLCERITAMLELRGRFNDDDVKAAVQAALRGLIQQQPAA
jgi:hypothetical protein